ncbi:peptidoglycan-binding protein [Longispora fulva]|uniref:Peptidoglycan hydrolase-like protein with peptidoglycan-binding domain n=1 Tax=Longispora fulva TaxID=619741 RepID=A0A8J7GBT0_9ACTN|nr:peptidoglycan-binding protein [Longispora fulva]MBG6134621.1 peptidoglycan hydrolase-like protein with peptidoglycan-binding domain [Longispora fulva]GIG61828.1 peptidoglycan-binding protein [Longispora fulva]
MELPTRRWLLTQGALVAATIAAPTAWATSASAALPAVDMELVLLAAQVDPPKPDTGTTPGAKAHVLPVERALNTIGLLATSAVDGHYGSSTIAAYAAWQRQLGYSGIDANGLPGVTSLTRLGETRFTVVHPVRAGSRTDSYGGRLVNTRTATMLAAADASPAWDITLSQGSYTTEDPTSAGTHDGGGVVDISVTGMSTARRWQLVQALRTVGFAAWLRTPEQGFPFHIHAVAVSDPDLSGPAQRQVHDYYFGRNGLANHAVDDTPPDYQVPFTWWEKAQRGQPAIAAR